MTVQDVRQLDDEQIRATVQLAAQGGNDHAATLLFFWAQWRKISATKKLSPKKKILAFDNLFERISKSISLTFTYGL